MTTRPARPARPVLPATLLAALLLGACGGGTATPLPSHAPASPGSGCPSSAPPVMAAGETRTVTIETAKGTIVVKIEADLGPRAAANFVALAGCGFYDGVVFHRLVPGFVIQGGDPTGSGTGGPGYAFEDDPVNVAYDRGVVAMANSGPDTNGSQFFIVLEPAGLPPAYSVFGRVSAGMDVVDAIAAMPNSGGRENRALDPVAMDHVTVSTP
jgi:cyclophilin family peptidyl-prolyl cis-trans isomerase